MFVFRSAKLQKIFFKNLPPSAEFSLKGAMGFLSLQYGGFHYDDVCLGAVVVECFHLLNAVNDV